MPGINGSQFSNRGFLELVCQHIVLPPAYDNTNGTLTSSTDGGSAGALAYTALVPGPLFLTGFAKTCAFRNGRQPMLRVICSSFSTPFSLTLRVNGKRFGRRVTQDITATVSSATTFDAFGTNCVDEVTDVSILATTGTTTQSATFGLTLSNNRLGLLMPIRNKRSVKFFERIFAAGPTIPTASTSGTVSSGGPRQLAVINQFVFPADSSLDVFGLAASGVILGTDRFYIEYLADGIDEFQTDKLFGKKYNP